jgi:hypothetical protein
MVNKNKLRPKTKDLKLSLHGATRLNEDLCYINNRTYQSTGVGHQILTTPGYKPHQQINQYASELSDVAHYPKQYRNFNHANTETKLQQSELTKYKQHKQLFTRPYTGYYMGPGQNSLMFKDLESNLLTGEIARISKSNNLAGITIDRFQYLPECCYPQNSDHIIMKGIVRGGEATRDFVRRNIHIQKTGNFYLN